MKKLTFIRHAESVANAGGVTMPHDAIPLSDLGRLQARELATALDVTPATVLVSSFIRTHQTAQPYCERFDVCPKVCPHLNEFSVIDPALIDGLDGAQRKPFVKAYWDDPNIHRRIGANADTFAEFDARVIAFMAGMDDLPDASVIFGHGIWFGLLLWRLLGYTADDAAGMRSFRHFQLGFPMPNCAAFTLTQIERGHWSVRASSSLALRISNVRLDIGAFQEDALAESDAAGAQEALTSWAAYQETGRHLTGQEVRTWLSAWGTEDENAVPACHR
ncbi:histidine phosphatase family protein [Collimonas antrihumi]|uniref:histidine phosphatase family protein n=1 Tax=Collimonas antrihumi TaxID=1940615 RepID=UPI001B8D0286|nr:histidine phosphatase family protein [Collimonas antrihumi]